MRGHTSSSSAACQQHEQRLSDMQCCKMGATVLDAEHQFAFTFSCQSPKNCARARGWGSSHESRGTQSGGKQKSFRPRVHLPCSFALEPLLTSWKNICWIKVKSYWRIIVTICIYIYTYIYILHQRHGLWCIHVYIYIYMLCIYIIYMHIYISRLASRASCFGTAAPSYQGWSRGTTDGTPRKLTAGTWKYLLKKEKHRPKPPILGVHVGFWGCRHVGFWFMIMEISLICLCFGWVQ